MLQQEAAIFIGKARAYGRGNQRKSSHGVSLPSSTLPIRGDNPKTRNFRGESGTGEAGEAPSEQPVGSPHTWGTSLFEFEKPWRNLVIQMEGKLYYKVQ